MPMTQEMPPRNHDRNRVLVLLLAGFVAPFLVLLVPAPGDSYVRAAYAVCLVVLMAAGGAWVSFRANTEELAKRWTPQRFKPGWAVFMRLAGFFVIVVAAFLMKSTGQDVVELLTSGRPQAFVATARSVESKAFLHPIFQAVRFREGKRFATYMFAYGGKRLIPGQTYAVTVLPRSEWILSAREVKGTAERDLR